MNKVMIGILLMVFNMGLGLSQNSGTDPLQSHLFSAESIMRNQRELGLDEEQRSYMVKQIQETQSEYTSLQWQLQDEVGRLSGLLENAETPERGCAEAAGPGPGPGKSHQTVSLAPGRSDEEPAHRRTANETQGVPRRRSRPAHQSRTKPETTDKTRNPGFRTTDKTPSSG